jgi:hypothetical protein
MKLNATSYYLIRIRLKTGRPVWVSFKEHGNFDRTEPYLYEEKERTEAIVKAKARVVQLARIFKGGVGDEH